MARIRRFTLGVKSAVVHPTEVDAVVKVVTPVEGGVLLQISTFGSENRESEPKVSQTIQFDRERALELRAFIDIAFEF